MATRVLFLGGSGRSGTTLLARVIGQIPGFWTGGEIREIWRERTGQNRLCGCGQPFHECPFWHRVGEVAFGGWEDIERSTVESMVNALDWAGAFGSMLRPGRAHLISAELAAILRRLYVAIGEVADGAVIVDTSKGPPYGVALSGVPDLEFRALHVVRDSRGVANSWLKEIEQPHAAGGVLRGHKLAAVASVRWLVHNAEMEFLGQRVPMARVIYEQFAADPRDETVRMLHAVGFPIEPDDLRFLEDDTVQLNVDHTVAGNPNRHETGAIRVRVDSAWERLSPLQRLQVTAMTWPMLLRYGSGRQPLPIARTRS
jgi:hypothetical protein